MVANWVILCLMLLMILLFEWYKIWNGDNQRKMSLRITLGK